MSAAGAARCAGRFVGRRLKKANGRGRKHPLITITLALWLTSTVGVLVGWAAPTGATTPTGLGALIPLPDLTHGGSRSLFESSGFLTWSIDAKFGALDIWQPIVQALADVIWLLAAGLVYGAVGLVYWLLSVASFNNVTDALTTAVGQSSATLLQWMLPSALVLGLMWNWIQHRGAAVLSAIVWTLTAAVFSLSLAMFPAQWVAGINNTRTVGSDAILSLTADAVRPNQNFPFSWPATDYGSGSTTAARQTVMLRKAGDSVWRGLVVTPWCIEEFGSMEACSRYGTAIVKMGANQDQRQEYINKTVANDEGGQTAPTVKYINGGSPQVRLVIALVALVVNLVFTGVILILGFSAVAALIGTFFHLLLGVPFSLLWCIEGRPRQIGIRWLESLVGTIIQGLVAIATFSAMLTLLTVEFAGIASIGWLPTLATGLVIVVSALGFRKQVLGFFGVVAGGRAGAAILGAVAFRALSRVAGGRRGGGAPSRVRQSNRTSSGEQPSNDRTARPASGPPASRPAPRATPTGRPPRRPLPGPSAARTGSGSGPSGPATRGPQPSRPGPRSNGSRPATPRQPRQPSTAGTRPSTGGGTAGPRRNPQPATGGRRPAPANRPVAVTRPAPATQAVSATAAAGPRPAAAPRRSVPASAPSQQAATSRSASAQRPAPRRTQPKQPPRITPRQPPAGAARPAPAPTRPAPQSSSAEPRSTPPSPSQSRSNPARSNPARSNPAKTSPANTNPAKTSPPRSNPARSSQPKPSQPKPSQPKSVPPNRTTTRPAPREDRGRDA